MKHSIPTLSGQLLILKEVIFELEYGAQYRGGVLNMFFSSAGSITRSAGAPDSTSRPEAREAVLCCLGCDQAHCLQLQRLLLRFAQFVANRRTDGGGVIRFREFNEFVQQFLTKQTEVRMPKTSLN
jgi:hypothetical protein